MKYFKRLIITLCTAFYFCLSSCNYLNVDEYFADTLGYDSIFQNKMNLQKYLWATAAFFPDEGAIWGGAYTPGVTGSDEAFVQWNTGEFPGVTFVLGHTTPDNLGTMNNWAQMYKIIRKVNIIFSRINECKDLTNIEQREILGYAHFMRGYAYYNLLQNFGPVVLVGDEPMNTNESPAYYNKERATYDESVDYICNELEIAANYIPLRVTVSQFGRPTRGAAYALIARLRLQQASPLFNGGSAAKTTFGGWIRKSDNVPYVSQTYDEQRWAVAAHAAKRVIDMDMYELHTVKSDKYTPELPTNVSDVNYYTKTFPEGAVGIDPYKSYSDMFTGESTATKNPEYIWGRTSGSLRSYTRHAFPVGLMGGYNGMAVPQKFIDAYYMVDGRDRTNSSDEYPYLEDGFTSEVKSFSGYQLKSGVYNMYINREPRFYASIGFSGCFWPCASTSEAVKKNVYVYYWKGASGYGASGKDKAVGSGDANNYPVTGYVMKKYVHNDDAWSGTDATVLPKSFPIIRYAEILLSYVEALNNLTGSHTVTFSDESTGTYTRDMNEMAKYFNMVRYRAGLPGLTTDEFSSADKMFDIIVRERMIEFLHENRRFYDVRRWGIYLDTEKEPIVGMNTDGFEDEFFQRTTVNHLFARTRVADKKMVFLPIPRAELRKVPLMDQNPGWDN